MKNTKQDKVNKKKCLWDEKEFEHIKDSGQLFDMICVRNFMAGGLGQNIPVDENRRGFEILTNLIKK